MKKTTIGYKFYVLIAVLPALIIGCSKEKNLIKDVAIKSKADSIYAFDFANFRKQRSNRRAHAIVQSTAWQ